MDSAKMDLFSKKMIVSESEHGKLRRCLSSFDLILFGIGAIIGAGIFVLTGIAAATHAGPAVVLSYVLAGIACSFAALSYAELASSIGGSGSAYNYAYASFGELIAWIIGWDLILEYAAGACTVAIGWSGYMNNALSVLGLHIPDAFQKGPLEGGILNVSAMSIVALLTLILILGVKQSARFNAVIVSIKLAVIVIFIAVAATEVNFKYWHPFMPFGWSGVVSGAALVFFAYIGFDAVSTAAEEAKDPQRGLSIGIIGSLFVCTLIYIVVSGLLTAIADYSTLNVKSPVAQTLLNLGHTFSGGLVSFGAIAGLTSVILLFIYGLSRVFFAMSRDGLLFEFFSEINPITQTPVRILVFGGSIIALAAGLTPIGLMAEMVNIGTLSAFIIVCAGVIVLRKTHPELIRPFKIPFSPYIPFFGILSCGYLMISLPLATWLRFIVWMTIGLVIYFSYGYYHSKLRGAGLTKR